MTTSNLTQTASPLIVKQVNHHLKEWSGCNKCNRHIFCGAYCFYRGHVPAPVLFIGEAPGDSENILGRPLVGRPGDKLNEIIADVLPDGMKFAVTTVVACAPFDDEGTIRDPMWTERIACRPRLEEFVKLCCPRIIVGVGRFGEDAAKSFDRPWTAIKHPSWILRQTDSVLESQRAIITLKEALHGVGIVKSPEARKQAGVQELLHKYPGKSAGSGRHPTKGK